MKKEQIKDALHAKEVILLSSSLVKKGINDTVTELFSNICGERINVIQANLFDLPDTNEISIRAKLDEGLIVYLQDVQPNIDYCTFTLCVYDVPELKRRLNK